MMDLHMHSICSDGTCSPEALWTLAETHQLRWFSITDHDNMDAYEQLKDKQSSTMHLIPGVEMTFQFYGLTMDMLGYGIDQKVMESFGLFHHHDPQDIIHREQHRLDILMKEAAQLHLTYTHAMSIQNSFDRANDVMCDDLLRYEENHSILQDMGITNRTTFYRNHYLNEASPFYMPQEKDAPDMEIVAKAIHQSGGLTFLAHLFVYDVEDSWQLLDRLVQTGWLDGIECLHRRHTQKQSDALLSYCEEHKLYVSGGSDLHKVEHRIGHSDHGHMVIDEKIALPWLLNL